ncbi:hypothetical protein AB0G42_21575 [Streptomyces yangpuensis]|uniref:hypothetical protein n=1 Tax=Streptomyces yangpuensis TaxID=1648182 RepID=UPI00342D114F
MIFKLSNGYRVRTTTLANGTEFVTKNAAGEIISSVVKYGAEAEGTLHNLRVADGIRFARQYGRRIHVAG